LIGAVEFCEGFWPDSVAVVGKLNNRNRAAAEFVVGMIIGEGRKTDPLHAD
jgi:hypothetical protein